MEQQDKNVQYLLFAAEPYEVIAFKIPNVEIDNTEDRFFYFWCGRGPTNTFGELLV